MRITALHLHPIKGCHRTEVDRAVVGPYGLVGDREWQVVKGEQFVTQRTHPKLATVRPALTEGGIVLRAEERDDLFVQTPTQAYVDSTTYSGPVQLGDAGDDAAAWLSGLLGDDVRLGGIAPGYERATGFFATESNLGDVAPITVVNEASHRFLLERASEPFGIERWRGNVHVDAPAPWAEDTWRVLSIGGATVRLVIPWPRCAVPQVDQEDGSRHREPAVVLKHHRWCASVPEDAPDLAKLMLAGSPLFAVAGAIEPAGATIAVGDEVVVVETGPALL